MEDTADRELIITRTYEAPRKRVWEAWTDPVQLNEWWGPQGFTTTTDEADIRAGGHWKFTMHGPDGFNYPNDITFKEVVAPKRIVYLHAGAEDLDLKDFETTVTFEEEDGVTRVTLQMVFESAEELTKQKEFGAVEGGKSTLDHLAEYLESAASTHS